VGYGAAAPPERENAFDLAFRAAAPALGAKSYILFLSRIHPKKGCDLLLSAFASLASHHPNVDVVIAGPDQVGWRAELEALASRLGIPDRVHWTGPLYGDAKWGAFYGADAFILPSHVENFGIAVAEALACGVPVLISDKVNIWREIEAADAGIVDADTLEGTKRLLSNWLTLSNATKQAMRLAAATIFAEAFDLRKTAPALLDTMRTLL
jgi:glycosyltransferase involved in cell wall biosynthesis